MKTVFIAGGSGLIGKRLAELLKNGRRVFILTRSIPIKEDGLEYLLWNPEDGTIHADNILPDIIINLAGAGIADKKWSAERKNEIIQSRTQSALGISKWLKENNHTPDLYIGASAIGYYGDRQNELLDENSKPGSGFLSECAEAWEAAHNAVIAKRKIYLRIGIVLSVNGGALPKILMTVPVLRLLSYFGSGKQMQSWIHIDDLCQVMVNAINDERYEGIINGVSTLSIDNKGMVKAIARALPFYTWIAPVPAFVLKMILGEMAHVVLDSTRVVPQKLITLGFEYKWPDLIRAIQDLRTRRV